ncbi:MAG: hypothetical protein ACI4VG_07335 [Lachnospiraceae bacterium]
MKELKNKEVIIGLIIIIILGVIALFLLIRREMGRGIREEEPETKNIEQEGWYGENAEAVPTEEELSTADEKNPAAETGPASSVQEGSDGYTLKVEGGGNSSSSKSTDFYSILGKEKYHGSTLVKRKTDDGQLKELFEFWDAYKMEAVHDLLRLDRIKEISAELKGTNKFYYYGSVDSLGRPSGKGLAVYGNNTYYCGEWKEGLRSGQGMWLQLALYDETNEAQNTGILEHMYNGRWSRDLPNGQGQEHFSYDYTVLEVEDKTIANVIGNFTDGYYDGEMYIMSTDGNGNTKDWNGVCKKGVWETLLEGSLTKGVWRSTEMNEQRYYDFHYMFPEENVNQGVYGLKK